MANKRRETLNILRENKEVSIFEFITMYILETKTEHYIALVGIADNKDLIRNCNVKVCCCLGWSIIGGMASGHRPGPHLALDMSGKHPVRDCLLLEMMVSLDLFTRF